MIKKVNEIYTQALLQCNEEQLQAIMQTQGTVLVIAGPGTGKTQILSLRIARILEATDATYDNILCLTYTDAGRLAMRKRLEAFLGPDAYRIPIHTFHSFCNEVIANNRSFFGIASSHQNVTELEQITLIRQLLDGLENTNPLKRFSDDVYTDVPSLKYLFSEIKSERLDPEALLQTARNYIDEMPTMDEFIYKKAVPKKAAKPGDPNLGAIKEATKKMDRFMAAVQLYKQYLQSMSKASRFDFNDMINWVIDAFKTHDSLLAQYQEQYQYLLVDEFQDTNGAQNEIISLLCSYWDDPNLFVVGDDDQSIYSFQGAEISRIESFIHSYRNTLKPIMLTGNYRSNQEILSAATALIAHNSERVVHNTSLQLLFKNQNNKELEKNIASKNPAFTLVNDAFIASGVVQSVTITQYTNVWHEEALIIEQLEALQQQGQSLGEVALIYRNHKQIERIIKVLEHRNIPYNARLRANLFEIPFAKNLITLLQYLCNEYTTPISADHLLYEILHYPYWNIPYTDIQTLAYQTALNKGKLRQSIENKQFMFQIGLEKSSAISNLASRLSQWQGDLANQTPQELFENVLFTGGIMAYVLQSDQKIALLEIIASLFDQLKDACARNPKLTLQGWLQTLALMEESNISLPIERIVSASNGVHLLTAHASKGLEFDHVFLIGCTTDQWEEKAKRSQGFKYPPTLVRTNTSDRSEQEERRLFYVAMTRAKKKLHISYPIYKVSGSKADAQYLSSRFVTEVKNALNIPLTTAEAPEPVLGAYMYQSMLQATTPDSVKLEQRYINDALANYKLSVTHLNKYLRCPLTFYYENIIKVPTARSASAGFGNAVHEALHLLFVNMKQNGNVFPSAPQFVGYFQQAMERYRSHFTEQSYMRNLEYGTMLLPEYYAHNCETWNKVTVTEYRPNSVFEGIPLAGALDKIEFNDKVANVVDYKTGKPERAAKKLKPPKETQTSDSPSFEDRCGGDYWRQLVFYKILLDNDRIKDWHMQTGELAFIVKDKNDAFTTTGPTRISPEDIDIVKQQIRDTYQGILNQDFHGCGDDDCHWCTFVKQNFKGTLPDSNDE